MCAEALRLNSLKVSDTMKTILITAATIIVLLTFTVFQIDNDSFMREQENLKRAADDCSAAASLYYDQEAYAIGTKIFNKAVGNEAILYLLKENLDLNSDLASNSSYFGQPFKYHVYYFDGDETMTKYIDGQLIIEKQGAKFPYLFREDLTGYSQEIREATVIVTIDAGPFNYRLSFIHDPECIRTSGYEYFKYE